MGLRWLGEGGWVMAPGLTKAWVQRFHRTMEAARADHERMARVVRSLLAEGCYSPDVLQVVSWQGGAGATHTIVCSAEEPGPFREDGDGPDSA
jgi:hypothetical protein